MSSGLNTPSKVSPREATPAVFEDPLAEPGRHILPVALADYASGAAAAGARTFPGSASTWWVEYKPGSIMRLPLHVLHHPPPSELTRLFWVRFAPLVTFLAEPDAQAPADSVHYVCRDNQYSLQKLEHAAQTNIRRGLRELRIEFLTHAQLLQHGGQAFIDTHRRFDPETGTAAEFERQYTGQVSAPGNVFIGAWKNDILAAFLYLLVVDDWVLVNGRCARHDCLNLRPNETLLFAALFHFLVEKKVRLVSAGTASIAAEADTPGLHRFKLKMGFEALPVRRVFILHPSLRPLAHQPARAALSLSRKLCPSVRWLRLMESVLKHVTTSPSP